MAPSQPSTATAPTLNALVNTNNVVLRLTTSPVGGTEAV